MRIPVSTASTPTTNPARDVQKLTDRHIKEVDHAVADKEKELMSV